MNVNYAEMEVGFLRVV